MPKKDSIDILMDQIQAKRAAKEAKFGKTKHNTKQSFRMQYVHVPPPTREEPIDRIKRLRKEKEALRKIQRDKMMKRHRAGIPRGLPKKKKFEP